ncbi:MAG: hypothetical protein R3B70_46145 [Polyangiaceae bacterium]
MGNSSDQGVPAEVRAFAERLSGRVRAALPLWEWAWHPEWRVSREEFQQALAEHGVPEWPFLWPLEEAFAGADVDLGAGELKMGIAADLPYSSRARLVDEDGQLRFIALSDWGNDTLVLDAKGRVCVLEELGQVLVMAPSFESFLEYHALSKLLRDDLFSAHIVPRTAAADIALRLGVPPVPEAYNDVFRWWQDKDVTLFAWVEHDLPAAVWTTTLEGLARVLDAAAEVCPGVKIKPIPSYAKEHVQILPVEEIRARAPSEATLSSRPGARRVELLGEDSVHPGKAPSTGDVWISGEGESLQVEVLERHEGEVVNFWRLTPRGSEALLRSTYGNG